MDRNENHPCSVCGKVHNWQKCTFNDGQKCACIDCYLSLFHTPKLIDSKLPEHFKTHKSELRMDGDD